MKQEPWKLFLFLSKQKLWSSISFGLHGLQSVVPSFYQVSFAFRYALQLRVAKDTLLYNETCFAARALVKIFLDLHEKHGQPIRIHSID